ncbi:MAG: hypothetical protein BGP24_15085 [Lysobacterales bacterium 69-70]|nr:hypothetical protein [Xanthomonadaceae bacterium]ODU35406.1 MAG: hypothetical protein ABS97_05910 [Xanthomonadaceae bacterium SCN 69-320]ODV16831.1 MAG: hypothetical protein ABT27_18805 [Xanthomonadaceae bacterium SCN 69-25]OJY94299.1 MAG: hypothetical protein BGP24_15085 [Xanthomonadales bacterium 69-70]
MTPLDHAAQAGCAWTCAIRTTASKGAPPRASLEGKRPSGVPVIGARFANCVNANVSPGVRADYPAARPLTTRAAGVMENDTPRSVSPAPAHRPRSARSQRRRGGTRRVA